MGEKNPDSYEDTTTFKKKQPFNKVYFENKLFQL
jgi:hypothetical protein